MVSEFNILFGNGKMTVNFLPRLTKVGFLPGKQSRESGFSHMPADLSQEFCPRLSALLTLVLKGTQGVTEHPSAGEPEK